MARGKAWTKVAEDEFNSMDTAEQDSFRDLYQRTR